MEFKPPTTVTFNARPQDEAQYRSAQLGSRVIGWTLGVASLLLGLVACAWSLNFAASLAVSWGEAVKLGLVAIGGTLALTGLPVAAAILQRSCPVEAANAMGLWLGALCIAAVGMSVFVVQLEPVEPHLDTDAAARERELRGVTPTIWHYSASCTQPENDYQVDRCDALSAAPWSPTADWSPRGILPTTASDDGPIRRVLVLAFGLLAIAGAGLLGRLAVLAMSETYRLGIGEAGPVQAPVDSAGPALAGPAILTPIDAFSMWVNGRLLSDASGEVTGSSAYEDYAETCKLNGIQPMPAGKFGSLLTTRADASGGQVMKVKSHGIMKYRGWSLPGPLEEVAPDRLSGPSW